MIRYLWGVFVVCSLSVGALSAQERAFDIHLVKVNVLPLVAQSYSLSYETFISNRVSIGTSVNYKPSGGFPLRAKVENYYTDTDIRVSNTQVGQLAITPEVRFYLLSSSSLRGFYISSFLQYANYRLQAQVDYIGGEYAASPSEFDFRGKMDTYSFGVALGYQWRLSNKFYLDWQMIGPHFGVNKGNFGGSNRNNKPLNEVQQEKLINKPDEFYIPLVKVDVDANSSQIDVRTSGYWASMRLGLSVGYRF
ncbi:DUF3575 domain-containing protein [Sphingobacterium wenxiniae]|uniref:DUF3575 domain-containing protein n=1 Tax=Sphingobacterium wenxiniae TaxID=683125 RepID=A0A1I6U8L9_9SPHI|nr:DUF3575 domain-containing protein [Sphingobacterium wenxiniae]SFS97869.1 Protein of unknown function [Sphingobacterium wenxiniae]